MAKGVDSRSPKPAYVPWKTFIGFLDQFQGKGLPARIDRSVLQGKSGASQSQLIGALKFLGLIDDNGTPSSDLLSLVVDPSARQEVMGKLVKSKYAEALEISRQNGTQAMLEEEFSSYGVRGSTHRKAVGFFLAAAKLGGIEVSGHFHTPRRIRPGARRPNRGQPSDTEGRGTTAVQDPDDEDGVAPSVDALRARYIEMLMGKAEESDDNETLFNRIERLLEFPGGNGGQEEE